jgi:mersacidin/lichenicidin family type 2 lantibiotic
MTKANIIRAWKDPAYRNSLSPVEREAMPVNPAGAIEISDADLGKIAGGRINLSQFGICRTHNCTLDFCTNQCVTNFISCLTLTIC